ncbi:tetratricopeptide repeat protein [Candidatus Peregrinibacteria bacterium]|jgi:tetratricopeptide (TPR) repeat protein|nr:tetratricopeptide repeat protein [Candidatus Peregrinibacteria bacterium]MBT7483265.1 tetratricopeptide repeat protein [Candidatus Peregrinibacteria bacterium]MBT7703362.1 tetratricopeptide repeat protein [Candidatus Peregrinibacteria bacterium]
MFYWILFLISGLTLGLIFWRRYLLALKSISFEEELKKEESKDKEPEEMPLPEDDELTDLQKKRHEEQRAREEKTSRIRKAKRAFKQADVHFTKGDYGLAEKHLLQVLSFDNDHLDANLKLGLLYLQQENLPRAEFFFQKLIDLKENPIYFSNLALTLYQQNRLEEAVKLYERAIEMDDKRAGRFVSVAHVYHELGDMEKALAAFEEATRLEPRNLDYLWALTDYYEKFSQIDDIIATLKRILELDPYNEDAKAKMVLLVEVEEDPVEEEQNSSTDKDEQVKMDL